ncbi:hypothetical protein CLOM_g13275 [Closterium sp. NIES-68]|nr:hypothetical protein CLOM_g13275 [Closterium sp. NIES-68]GJP79182.1 hypothetical protein CLOP_g9422 [Closterium sp. NIES-67]
MAPSRSFDDRAASPPPCRCFTSPPPAHSLRSTSAHPLPVHSAPDLHPPARHFSVWSKRRLSAAPPASAEVPREGPSHGGPATGDGNRRAAWHESNVARSLATNARRLQRQLRRLAVCHGRHLNLGVAVVHLPSGQSANVRAARQFPLASVAKLPLLFAAAHAIHCPCPCHSAHRPHTPALPLASCTSGSGSITGDFLSSRGLTLSTVLQVREEDKCIGSGVMWSLPSGTAVTLHQCLSLMNCVSDNTAADLVFKAVGWPCVSGLLHSHGARDTSVHLTQRQAYLLALGLCSDLREPYGRARAESWQGLSLAQQRRVAGRAEGESRAVSVGDMRALEEASLHVQRAQGDKGYRNDYRIAAAMDNQGSPADMAHLLSALCSARLLPSPPATGLCLHTMAMQEYGRRRLPFYLPPSTPVLHKTGSILGIVNAAGIIPLPRPPSPLLAHRTHSVKHLPLLPTQPASPHSSVSSSPSTSFTAPPLSPSSRLPAIEHAEGRDCMHPLAVGEGGAVVVAAFVDGVWRQHEREAEYVIARASKLAYDTWGGNRRLRRMLSARERRRWLLPE